MPRKTTTPTETPETPATPALEDAIADRYLAPIAEIAPAIAREFWKRLDSAVTNEIDAQRPDRAGFWEKVRSAIATLPSNSEAIAVLPAGGVAMEEASNEG